MYTILNKDDVFGSNSSIARNFYETIRKQDEARKILHVETTSSMIKVGTTFDGKELTKHVIARARGQFVDGKLFRSMEILLANVNSIDKQMKMHLIRGDRLCHRFYASMTQMTAELEPMGFLRIQKSYLVNMEYIEMLKYGETRLKGGIVLKSSEKNHSEIKQRYSLWRAKNRWSIV